MSLLEGHFQVCHHLWESRTRQHLPTLPPRLLWPFFNSVPWFSDGFFGGRRWSRKDDIFLRSCFWGEWNKHTWSHIKGMKVKFRRNKKYMDMWVETEKPWKCSPPKKKNITPFWWASAGGVSQVRGVCQVFCGARVGEYYAPLDLCHVKALLSYKKVALLSHSQPSNSRNSHGHMIFTFV